MPSDTKDKPNTQTGGESKRSIRLSGQELTYHVRYSEDATEPRIDIDIHDIKVVLPSGSDIDPGTLLAENARWVMDTWRKYESHREKAPSRTFEPGEQFLYRGRELPIVIKDIDAAQVTSEAFVLPAEEVNKTGIRDSLEDLYRRTARSVFASRIEEYADEMNVTPGKLELRNQRTRWASCSPKRTLSFNWRLVMAPDDVIDYVVIHELAHLLEANHTRQFWNIVERYDPEYESHVDWLAENSARLIFTEDDL